MLNKGTNGIYHREDKIMAGIFSTHWISIYVLPYIYLSALMQLGEAMWLVLAYWTITRSFWAKALKSIHNIPDLSFPSPKMMETS